jgi:hypothetical protein
MRKSRYENDKKRPNLNVRKSRLNIPQKCHIVSKVCWQFRQPIERYQ